MKEKANKCRLIAGKNMFDPQTTSDGNWRFKLVQSILLLLIVMGVLEKEKVKFKVLKVRSATSTTTLLQLLSLAS